MAYADYKFYTESFGNVVPETDFPRLAERASDFVDTMTFDRLVDGLPETVFTDSLRAEGTTSGDVVLGAIENKLVTLDVADMSQHEQALSDLLLQRNQLAADVLSGFSDRR